MSQQMVDRAKAYDPIESKSYVDPAAILSAYKAGFCTLSVAIGQYILWQVVYHARLGKRYFESVEKLAETFGATYGRTWNAIDHCGSVERSGHHRQRKRAWRIMSCETEVGTWAKIPGATAAPEADAPATGRPSSIPPKGEMAISPKGESGTVENGENGQSPFLQREHRHNSEAASENTLRKALVDKTQYNAALHDHHDFKKGGIEGNVPEAPSPEWFVSLCRDRYPDVHVHAPNARDREIADDISVEFRLADAEDWLRCFGRWADALGAPETDDLYLRLFAAWLRRDRQSKRLRPHVASPFRGIEKPSRKGILDEEEDRRAARLAELQGQRMHNGDDWDS